VHVAEAIVDHLRVAGATVLLAPPGEDPDLDGLLHGIDGVVVTGGAHDIHPRHYGQDVRARIGRTDESRVALELPLIRACLARDLPLLGICGGMQAMAVATGGTLVQDLATCVPGALEHEQPHDPAEAAHALRADPALRALFGDAVNSTHHQAVDVTGAFTACAWAPDGVVEAIRLSTARFALGVQWHPEWRDGRLFHALVAAARP
jgi:putative glutamine amidotransferase